MDMLLRNEVGQRHQFERHTRPRPEPTGPSDRKCPLFPKRGRYSDEICVALVTPATFKRPDGEYRAYQGMFREYESDRAKLRRDLDACRLGKRDRPDWKYPPDIAERVDRLKLRWPTYEELFAGIPPGEISGGLQRFWEKFGHIR